MEPEQKKRKLESEGTPKPAAPQPSDPLEGLDAKRMFDIIRTNKHTRNNAFQTFLASLEGATPEQARVVKSLIRPFLLSSIQPLHCVRCHQSYFESENSEEACESKHTGTKEIQDEVVCDSFGMRARKMRYICCYKEFADGDEDMEETCCTERHTTNTHDVSYSLEGEFEDNWTITCEEYGCVGESENEDKGEERTAENSGNSAKVIEISDSD